jgi:hypothetical protein
MALKRWHQQKEIRRKPYSFPGMRQESKKMKNGWKEKKDRKGGGGRVPASPTMADRPKQALTPTGVAAEASTTAAAETAGPTMPETPRGRRECCAEDTDGEFVLQGTLSDQPRTACWPCRGIACSIEFGQCWAAGGVAQETAVGATAAASASYNCRSLAAEASEGFGTTLPGPIDSCSLVRPGSWHP